jgi:hypothetical protein
MGWQSLQVFNGETRPAQTRKIAANPGEAYLCMAYGKLSPKPSV